MAKMSGKKSHYSNSNSNSNSKKSAMNSSSGSSRSVRPITAMQNDMKGVKVKKMKKS